MLVGEEFVLVEGKRRWLLAGFAGELVSLVQRVEMELCFHHLIWIDEAY